MGGRSGVCIYRVVFFFLFLFKFCGLARTVEELGQFTSTSIRRGNAITTEVEVQRLRAQRNKQFAWGAKSPTPRKHYCPEGVMLQPGSLFLDTEEIDRKCYEILAQVILDRNTNKHKQKLILRDHAAHLEGECNTAALAVAGWPEHLPPAQTRDCDRNK